MSDGTGHPYRRWAEPLGFVELDRQCRFCTAAAEERCYRCGRPLCGHHALPEWTRCETCEVDYLTRGMGRAAPRRSIGRADLALAFALGLMGARNPRWLALSAAGLVGAYVLRGRGRSPKSCRERFLEEKLW